MLVDKKYAQDDYYDADLEAWAAAEQAKLDAAKKNAEDKAAFEKEKIKEYTNLAFESAQVVSDSSFIINKILHLIKGILNYNISIFLPIFYWPFYRSHVNLAQVYQLTISYNRCQIIEIKFLIFGIVCF